MKVISAVLSFLLCAICRTEITKIIDVMTWDPACDLNEGPDSGIIDRYKVFEQVIRDTFRDGQILSGTGQSSFFTSINFENMRIFAPNSFTAYAIAYSRMQGLQAAKTKKNAEAVREEVHKLQTKELITEDATFYTLEDANVKYDNIFRVFDFSYVLEGSSFACPARKTLVSYYKGRISEVTCDKCQFLFDQSFNKTLEEIYTEFRGGDTSFFKGIDSKTIEYCLENYVLSTYYADENLIKLTAGPLLREIIDRLRNKSDEKLYLNYMVKPEEFLGLTVALQKVFLLGNEASHNFADSALLSTIKKYNKRISFEMAWEKSEEIIRIKVFGPENHITHQMETNLGKVGTMMVDFATLDYEDFSSLCANSSVGSTDMRKIIISCPVIYTDFKRMLAMATIIICSIVIIYYLVTRKKKEVLKTPSGKGMELKGFKPLDLEEGRAQSDDDESDSGSERDKEKDF